VFLPLITITGVTGTFFRALAVTVATALVTSLGLALTWTPTLSHYLLKRTGGKMAGEAESGNRLTRFYEKVLRFTLAWPLALAGACLALVVASYFCYNALGSDLLPAMDEGGFILDYLMPAGSSLADTNDVLLGVEKILSKTPEVESTSRRTGLQLGLQAVTEANTGDFSVRLKAKRSRTIDQVMSAVRDKVNDEYPQLDVEFIQTLQDQIGDLSNSPEPIEIKLFSQDPNLLKQWGPKVGDRIKKISTVKDVKNGIENTISGSAIVMNVDPIVAARAGFTPQEIELDASAILQGEPATTPVVANGRTYAIRVRFPESARTSLEQIRNTLLTSSTGKTASLGSVAEFQDEAGQTEVRRENLQRMIAVTGRFEGVSLGEGMQTVQKAVADMHLPPSIRVLYGGTYEEQQKSFKDLALVLVLAVVLVFTVLLFEFRSFAAPTAILASALLSTSGVFLALLVTHTTFNISSFMGLIMVIGIVAKNGILLLDADQRYRAEGASARDAMIKAGERRLRPILMTALATMAGMIPLSIALGAGSQMLQPLAIAVIGGILASMVLSLIVTPAVHYYLSPRGE
jgi:multidrug efflux pump subunit AcrB